MCSAKYVFRMGLLPCWKRCLTCPSPVAHFRKDRVTAWDRVAAGNADSTHYYTNSAAWQLPYACAQPNHPGSGNHGQLFRPCQASLAWHSRRTPNVSRNIFPFFINSCSIIILLCVTTCLRFFPTSRNKIRHLRVYLDQRLPKQFHKRSRGHSRFQALTLFESELF